jgi:DNA invertase Pin-like site-specific DNA recombinase
MTSMTLEPATMQRAVGYIRVSTTQQATDGVSLDAQRARISGWCELNGYKLVALHADEGLSGKCATNRPALRAALADACQAKAALVVYSLSRLARSTKDALTISERLSKAGADLVSLSEKIDTTSAAGKMVFRMLAVLAEFERDVIAERTRAAMQHKRAKGERVSREAAYGSRLTPDGRVEADPIERRVVELVAKLHTAGWSLRKIAAALEAEGLFPRGGRRWHPQTIARIAATCTGEERALA